MALDPMTAAFCDAIDAYFAYEARQRPTMTESRVNGRTVKHHILAQADEIRAIARRDERDRDAEHRRYLDRHNARADWLASQHYGSWVPVIRNGKFEHILSVTSRNGFRPITADVVFATRRGAELAILTIQRSGFWCGSGGSWTSEVRRVKENPWTDDRKKLLVSTLYKSGPRADNFDHAPNAWWSSWGYMDRPNSLFRLNVRHLCHGTDHVVGDYDPKRGVFMLSGDFA